MDKEKDGKTTNSSSVYGCMSLFMELSLSKEFDISGILVEMRKRGRVSPTNFTPMKPIVMKIFLWTKV